MFDFDPDKIVTAWREIKQQNPKKLSSKIIKEYFQARDKGKDKEEPEEEQEQEEEPTQVEQSGQVGGVFLFVGVFFFPHEPFYFPGAAQRRTSFFFFFIGSRSRRLSCERKIVFEWA